MSVGFAITKRRNIMDFYTIHILDSVPKPEDGNVWLTPEEFKNLDQEIFGRMYFNIRYLNNQWHQAIPSEINTILNAASLPFEQVQQHLGAYSLVRLPGVSKETFELIKSGIVQDVKLCEINKVLSAPVLNLITLNPKNQTIRSMVRAAIKRKLPDEAQTIEQIKDWIEKNVQQLVPVPSAKLHPAIAYNGPTFRAEVLNQHCLSVTLTVEDEESGSCSYSNSRRGVAGVPVSRDRVMELVEAEGASVNLIVDSIIREAKANLLEDTEGVEMDASGEMNYDAYEQSDDSPSNTTVNINHTNKERVRSDLISFLLNENLSEQQRTRLGL